MTRLPGSNPLIALAFLVATCGAGAVATAQIATVRVAADLEWPVFVAAPAGDPDRLFIVEQDGLIRLLKNGTLQPLPFLDIDALVPDVSFFDERGLLGLAFHPDYASNGYFFVNYLDTDGNTTITRYQVSDDPDLADPGSAFIVKTIAQPYANHNGGTLAFGPLDGYLYIGMGDGGSAGDPQNRAQDNLSLLGKMLRIDIDGAAPYEIPASNPFVGESGPLPEIWAKGLRNPYRFSFDRQTGDLYIADVGQWVREEIDFQPAHSSGGENYGWRLMEGTSCYEPESDCNDGTLVLPLFEYPHDARCSVTGGNVYRGAALPQLQGHYFFADWCSHQIWSFKVVQGEVTEFQKRTQQLAPGAPLAIESIVGFGEDGLGELYIVDRSQQGAGEVFKIVPSSPQPTVRSSWGGFKARYR